MADAVTLPEPPSANRWWRHVGRRTLLSRRAREYKAAAKVRAYAQGMRRIAAPAPVAVSVVWYRARRAGDLDKRLGILLDALQGIAYDSDAQVVEIHARRLDDPQRPRVEVAVGCARPESTSVSGDALTTAALRRTADR